MPLNPHVLHHLPAGDRFVLVYEDPCLLIVHKPPRLLSVPGRGPEKQDCLISAVQQAFPEALIVHRLDYDTSGLLVLARSKENHRALSILFQDRLVEKRYLAVVEGKLAQQFGEINLPLLVDWPNRPLHKVDFEHGKPAKTAYRVLEYNDVLGATRVELLPETGRTHQLRIHMRALGHPILGDTLYADAVSRAKADRLLLQANYLAFLHPGDQRPLAFTCAPEF